MGEDDYDAMTDEQIDERIDERVYGRKRTIYALRYSADPVAAGLVADTVTQTVPATLYLRCFQDVTGGTSERPVTSGSPRQFCLAALRALDHWERAARYERERENRGDSGT